MRVRAKVGSGALRISIEMSVHTRRARSLVDTHSLRPIRSHGPALKTVRIHRPKIFKIDAMGALLSILLLGAILPALSDVIGMPIRILHLMCIFPVVYLIYDIYCIWWADLRSPKWLKGIIAANLTYCVVTLVLVLTYRADLSGWGLLYFTLECLVISALVLYQCYTLRRTYARVDGVGLPESENI